MAGEPNMVERLAYELRERVLSQSGTLPWPEGDNAWADLARVAINAMRTATPAMIEAGRWPAEDDGPVACWKAMIDVALEDPSDAR